MIKDERDVSCGSVSSHTLITNKRANLKWKCAVCSAAGRLRCGPGVQHDISILMWTDRVVFWFTWRGGTSALVARSLSVSANVCRGAKALFPGQGKQIVGPFANEKKKRKRREEKRRRAGSGERCLAWQGDRDYTSMTFSSTQRKWRGSTGGEKLNPCTWEKFTISRAVTDTADCWCLTGCSSRMLTENKCSDLLESHPTAGRRWKERRKRQGQKKR